jgi:hypothetical protein
MYAAFWLQELKKLNKGEKYMRMLSNRRKQVNSLKRNSSHCGQGCINEAVNMVFSLIKQLGAIGTSILIHLISEYSKHTKYP